MNKRNPALPVRRAMWLPRGMLLAPPRGGWTCAGGEEGEESKAGGDHGSGEPLAEILASLS